MSDDREETDIMTMGKIDEGDSNALMNASFPKLEAMSVNAGVGSQDDDGSHVRSPKLTVLASVSEQLVFGQDDLLGEASHGQSHQDMMDSMLAPLPVGLAGEIMSAVEHQMNAPMEGMPHSSMSRSSGPRRQSLGMTDDDERAQRPHKCDVCPMAFKRKWDLKRHMLIHGDTRSFKCELCQKDFRLKTTLDSHYLTHVDNGLKPHKCDICGMSYKRVNSLYLHKQRVHAPDGKVICNFCGKTFTSHGWLVKHQAATHQGIPSGSLPSTSALGTLGNTDLGTGLSSKSSSDL
jgi:uncharacterized Zn-finger protein